MVTADEQLIKANNPEEMLDLVDLNDEVVGVVTRAIANKNPELIHREISVLLFDEQMRVVIQKRSKHKDVNPGLWSLVAGHVPTGAHPEAVAYVELEEEFGLTDIPLKFILKKLVEYPNETHFMYYFVGRYYGQKIDFNTDEVEAVQLVSESELEALQQSGEQFNNKYTPVLQGIWNGEIPVTF